MNLISSLIQNLISSQSSKTFTLIAMSALLQASSIKLILFQKSLGIIYFQTRLLHLLTLNIKYSIECNVAEFRD